MAVGGIWGASPAETSRQQWLCSTFENFGTSAAFQLAARCLSRCKIMAAPQPTIHFPTPRTWTGWGWGRGVVGWLGIGGVEPLADGSNKRVPSPSTVSTAALTRWTAVATQACEGGGLGGWVGGGERDPALEQVKYSSAPRESSRDTNTAETYGAGRWWARRVTLPPWRWGRGDRLVEGEVRGVVAGTRQRRRLTLYGGGACVGWRMRRETEVEREQGTSGFVCAR